MAGTKTLNDKHVGIDADVTVFSFQAVKNLPTADSGMICFKNEDYDILSRKLCLVLSFKIFNSNESFDTK
jgi:dTDP-4-amino-4,6-dideoxygalactose transaminase